MTEDPYATDGFAGPHSKRPKLISNEFNDKFSEGKKINLKGSSNAATPTDESDPHNRQQFSTTISFNINSVDSEKLSSPNSMTALSTSSTATDESGYQSGGNSSTPQPSVTSNVSMNGVFSGNTNLGFSSQGGQVSVVMTNMQTSGLQSQIPAANVNFNINKQFIPNPATGNMYQTNGPQNSNLAFNISSANTSASQYMPMNPGTASYHQNSVGANRTFTPPVEPSSSQKDILTRQQLIFFFCHSNVCIMKNANNSRPACKVPHCAQSRMILQHLQMCANSRFCNVPSCQGLRWAKEHYSNCKNMSCIYCEPVRRNRPAFAAASTQNNISTSSDLKKKLRDWIMSDEPLKRSDNGAGRKNPRFELNNKTRLSCIANMVSAIIPSNDSSANPQGCLLANDDQARQVIDLTRQVEVEVYYEATDKDQYFEMMARKSYEFQKRMEELQNKQQTTQFPPANHSLGNSLSSTGGSNCTSSAPANALMTNDSNCSLPSNHMGNKDVGVSSNGSILSSLLNNSRDSSSRGPLVSTTSATLCSTSFTATTNSSHVPSADSSSASHSLDQPITASSSSSSSSSLVINNNTQVTSSSNSSLSSSVSNSFAHDASTNSSLNSVQESHGGEDSNENAAVKNEPIKDEPMDTTQAKESAPRIKEEPMDSNVKTESSSESKDACEKKSPAQTTTSDSPSNDIKKEPDGSSELKSECKQSLPGVIKRFTIDEIRQSLWPVLQHIIGVPESEPFRVPVDYKSLGLTDYPEVVKEPMDISTIRKNMFDEEKYCEDPWGFISHMQLMFANAWLYNRKATKIYKSTTRLSEIFYEKIDEAMRSLGFCCGQHLTFSPIPIYCYQKLCHIPRDAKYYVWTNTSPKTGILSEKYIYCNKCFNETSTGIDCDEFPVSDEPGVPGAQVLNVHKTAFEQVTNNSVESEKFVKCTGCGRHWHVICAMYQPAMAPDFHCPTCLRVQGVGSGFTLNQTQELSKYAASRLPTNKMASFIERSVNKFLKPNDCPHVSIRVLSCSTKMAEVQPKMQSRFPDYPKQFPYRNKALFAFTQVDNRDVCIFGMTVQEYGSDCPQPNTRRVYLSYLDSVFFFEPRRLRTALYHRILIAYFDYCKQLGYDYAHIWACPPGEGDDYIFHCHPIEQKTPKPKRLQDWYKQMLDLAQDEGSIENYRDVQRACEDANPNGFTSATQLPYFEGDYWPKVLEDLITQVGDKATANNSNCSTSSANSIGGTNGVGTIEEEIHSVESDPAMTPGAQEGDVGANPPSADHMQQSCGTPNPQNVDEVASTPPSNMTADNVSSTNNNSTDKSQKQPQRKKSKKWSGNSSSRHKQRKQATLDLTEKVIQNMNSCRDSFFTIKLQTFKQDPENGSDCERSPTVASKSENQTRKGIQDPDPDVHYEMMEGRDSFLHMSREKYWEFSSLRRARYSTMCMLHELHTAGNSLCPDSKKDGQNAKADGSQGSATGKSAGTSKAEMMNQYIKVMVHATTCRNANCMNPPQCGQFKKLLSHMKTCSQRNSQQKTSGGTSKTNHSCPQCTNLFKMFIKHAETCNKGTQPCSVPYCQDIRRRNSRQDLMLRRRMAMMMQRTNSSTSNNAPSTPTGPSGANSPVSNNNGYLNSQPRTPYAPSPISVKDQSLQQNSAQNGPANCQQPTASSDASIASSASIGLSRPSQPLQTGNSNPPPGALEAAQRAKTMAAMQSSTQMSVYGPMAGGGGASSVTGPTSGMPYNPIPISSIGSLPSYQHQQQTNSPSMAPPLQSMAAAAGAIQDHSMMYHHSNHPGAMDTSGPNGGAMYMNGPVVSSYGPHGQQMMMMSPHQGMMRATSSGAMYYQTPNGQMQMAQMQMGHPMRGTMMRGPMPGMNIVGGHPVHASQMIMSNAYGGPQFAGGHPQAWRPGMAGGTGQHPSRMQMHPSMVGMRAQVPASMMMMQQTGASHGPSGQPMGPGGDASQHQQKYLGSAPQSMNQNPQVSGNSFVNGTSVGPNPNSSGNAAPNNLHQAGSLNSGETLQKFADSL